MSLIKLGIVGAGHFGSAIAQSFVTRGLTSADHLYVVGKNQKISDLDSSLDVLIICVRPQQFASLDKRHQLTPRTLVLSVMAGIRQQDIEAAFSLRSVRAMPNIAAAIGNGITVYKPHPDLSHEQKQNLEKILSHWGKSVAVEEEALLDVATAVSGSGPGILYWLLREMMSSAQAQGFSKELAEILVKEMLAGAAAHWFSESRELEHYITAVASKGGTTQAALEYLTKHNAGAELKAALVVATARCRHLGTQS